MKLTNAITAILIGAALIFCFVSCKDEDDDDDSKKLVAPMPDPNDTYIPPADSDDDTAGEPNERKFTVTFEYRNTAKIYWLEEGDLITDARIHFGSDYGYGNDLVMANYKYTGEGKILHFPESKFQIHTVYFHGPAIPEGPCGASPISYALSLTGQEGASERYGGIAAYCGTEISGRPARLLRIYGSWKK